MPFELKGINLAEFQKFLLLHVRALAAGVVWGLCGLVFSLFRNVKKTTVAITTTATATSIIINEVLDDLDGPPKA